MPYADNLYSIDDNSDSESFSDELSPTDGYFSQRNHPQEMMIPNPVVNENATAESKAQEAQAEASSNNDHITSYRPASPPLQPSEPSHSFTSPSHSRSPTDSPPTSYILGSQSQPRSQHSSHSSPTGSPFIRPYTQPPPAYSAAVSQSQVNEQPNYSTISNQQLEEGRSPFQQNREPESMGSPRDFENERAPLFRRPQNRASNRLSCRRLLLLLIFIALVTGSIIIGIMTGNSKPRSRQPEDKPSGSPGGIPGKKPGDHKGGDRNDSGGDKGGDSVKPAPIFSRPIASNGPYCTQAIYHVDESPAQNALDSSNVLRVFQSLEDQNETNNRYHHINTVGEVHIRKAPNGIKDAYITTDFYVSDRSLEVYITQETDDGYLVVKSSQWGNVHTPVNSCISIEITVWLPDYTQISQMNVGVTTLGIRVFEDVKAYISDSSNIGTVSGSISFPGGKPDSSRRSSVRSLEFNLPKLPKIPSLVDLIPKLPEYFKNPQDLRQPPSDGSTPDQTEDIVASPEPSPKAFSSRNTHIETISGPITGTFQQYDNLYLSTKSGNINAYIVPHSVLKSDPKPASLNIHSISGQIHAKYDLRYNSDLPVRDYRSEVSTTSGTITGDFIIGSQCHITTNSGNLDVSALPFGILEDHEKADFRTRSTSGGSDVVVLDPPVSTLVVDNDPYNLIAAAGAYTSLKSHHSSTSGHIHVRLPQPFEGQISAKSVSGGIRVVGEGVQIISRDDRGWGSKKVLAVKGEGDVTKLGDVTIDGISGSIDVEVGKVLSM